MANSFTWTDPNDTRDPEEMLRAEGVTFSDGSADASQRLSSDELALLIADQT